LSFISPWTFPVSSFTLILPYPNFPPHSFSSSLNLIIPKTDKHYNKCCITITPSIVPHKMLYHNYIINCSSQNVVSQSHHQLFLTKCCITITSSIVPHKMLYHNYTINCSSQNVVSQLHHQLLLTKWCIKIMWYNILWGTIDDVIVIQHFVIMFVSVFSTCKLSINCPLFPPEPFQWPHSP
jgi:hypothetical protein